MTKGLTTSVLGRTGLEVTRLGYGAMALRESSDDVSERVLNAVLDAGITFIDTSNDYGHSEEMIGKYVAGRRSEYYLATKCGCPPGGGEHVWTRENLFRGLHESLERLRTDYVDIMQLHNAKNGGRRRRRPRRRAAGDARAGQGAVDRRVCRGALDLDLRRPRGVRRVPDTVFGPRPRPRGRNHGRRAVGRGDGDPRRRAAGRARASAAGGTRSAGRRSRRPAWTTSGVPDESRTAFMLRYTLAHPGLHTTIVGTQNHGPPAGERRRRRARPAGARRLRGGEAPAGGRGDWLSSAS